MSVPISHVNESFVALTDAIAHVLEPAIAA